ncbi:MAG: methyltransferase, partial [Betaproteobacteria bacterium]|nr:methyltransferase [Betaproteobacteria bacterium]
MTAIPDPDAFTPAQLQQQFEDLLRAALAGGDLLRLSLSKYHGKEPELRRVLGRLVALKGRTQLSLVYRYRTRDVTRNFPPATGLAEVMQQLRAGFHHAHLTTTGEDVQLAANRRGDLRLQRGRLSGSAAAKTG